jgi:hypothetical protein
MSGNKVMWMFALFIFMYVTHRSGRTSMYFSYRFFATAELFSSYYAGKSSTSGHRAGPRAVGLCLGLGSGQENTKFRRAGPGSGLTFRCRAFVGRAQSPARPKICPGIVVFGWSFASLSPQQLYQECALFLSMYFPLVPCDGLRYSQKSFEE